MPALERLAFLVCPAEPLLDGFVRGPHEMHPDLVRALSSHLARCAPCREEVDRRRRGLEASVSLRPWIWALLGVAVLCLAAAVFLTHEISGIFPPGVPHEGSRPQPRLAALATFDPPDGMMLPDAERGAEARRPGAGRWPALSVEDRRQLAAAGSSLREGKARDAAQLLEDLVARHPRRAALRLRLAYAYTRSGEFDEARRHYGLADAQGAGREACWGLANAHLRLGDAAAARHELADHILARDPGDDRARDLLDRLGAVSPATRP